MSLLFRCACDLKPLSTVKEYNSQIIRMAEVCRCDPIKSLRFPSVCYLLRTFRLADKVAHLTSFSLLALCQRRTRNKVCRSPLSFLLRARERHTTN